MVVSQSKAKANPTARSSAYNDDVEVCGHAVADGEEHRRGAADGHCTQRSSVKPFKK